MRPQENAPGEQGFKSCEGSIQNDRGPSQATNQRPAPFGRRRIGHARAFRLMLFCSAAIATAFVVVPRAARAQGAPPAPLQGNPSGTTSTTTNASGKPSNQLEDVVVTAQRRSQRLQDVPLAITAVSAATLAQQGVSTTAELSQVVPSLVFTGTVNAATPYIRGVGSDLIDPTSESPVAIYVDDVYYASPQANVFTLMGIKDIDVLEGPQGTLFGRNATGGVIQIETIDPKSAPHLDASVTYGNYDTVTTSAYGSTGIGDYVTTSLSLLYQNQGVGYGHNIYNGDPTYQEEAGDFSLRNKWVIRLPTNTILHFAVDWDSLKNTDSYQHVQGTESPITHTPWPGLYNADQDLNDISTTRGGGISLKVDQDVGPLTLTSISAYRYSNDFVTVDEDQTPLALLDLGIAEKFHNFSEEFRLKNQTAPIFNWVAGAFYYDALGADDPFSVNGAPAIAYEQETDHSLAGFAQGTVTLFSNTGLTGGFRYTTDEQAYSFPAANMNLKQSVDNATYRIALDHHFTKDFLAYVSYNTGFKSGGYNLLAPGDAFKPEKLHSLEAGAKSEWFDHTLRLNVDGFLYQYTNQQENYATPGGNVTENAAGSHIKGIEANLDYQATEALRISGGVSLLHGYYTNYPGFPAVDQNGASLGVINEKGKTTVETPGFVGNISARYGLPTQVGNFVTAAGVQYNSGFFWNGDNRLRQPAYTMVNGSVTWMPDETDRYDAKLWVKNLLNQQVYVTRNEGAYPVGDNQIDGPTRTFGVTLSYHYD